MARQFKYSEAKLTLTNGQTVLIDAEDYEKLNQHIWYLKSGRYAATGDRGILMHRMILGDQVKPFPREHIDHINGNGLDNRRSNLRIATPAQNQYNSRRRKDNTSGYKGVCKAGNRFRAYLFHRGKQVYLGSAKTPEKAAVLYKKGAQQYYGEYANNGTRV
jgi:hypothetical protein